jgi:hypothetical protein
MNISAEIFSKCLSKEKLVCKSLLRSKNDIAESGHPMNGMYKKPGHHITFETSQQMRKTSTSVTLMYKVYCIATEPITPRTLLFSGFLRIGT